MTEGQKTPTTENSTSTTNEGSSISAKDQGWAWVVAFAGALVMAISLGMFRSTGILLVELMESFDSSATQASVMYTCWGISVTASALFLNTALGGIVHERALVALASAFGSLGFIIASLSRHLEVTTVCLGLFCGVSCQTSISSSFAIASKYFEKRLTVACGIVSSGTSCGVFLWPVLMRYLIDEYGYRGACLILGGVLMNGVVCAALMRPFPGTTISGSERKKFAAGKANDFNDIALTATSRSPSLSVQIRAASCDGVQGHGAISDDDILAVRSCADDITSHSLKNGTRRKSLQKNSKELVLRVAETRTKTTANGQFDTDPAVNCPVGDHAYARATDATSDAIGSRVQWLPNAFKQFVMMKQGGNTKRYSITDVFGIKFFKDPVFVLFSTFGMFYGVGNDFLFLFYPAVTQDLGFSYYDSAFLLSAMGVCGIVGRLLLGMVGECVPQRYLVVVVAQTIQGIAILLCRYAVTFWSQLIFAITIGLVYGVPYAYKTPLILDFFGDADMAKRIGVTSFVSGITSIIDPPLVGWLRDSTGDYSTSTYCSAALILSNGPILLTMRLLKRLDRRKKQLYDMDSRT